ALQDVVLLAQILDRTEKALGVLHEGHQDAQGYSSMQHANTTEPDNRGDSHRGEDFHYRVIKGVGKDGVFEGLHMLRVDLLKAAVGALFAIEELQHHHARDMLL